MKYRIGDKIKIKSVDCYQDAVGNICYTEVKLESDEKANQETFSKKIFGDDKYDLIAWSLIEK